MATLRVPPSVPLLAPTAAFAAGILLSGLSMPIWAGLGILICGSIVFLLTRRVYPAMLLLITGSGLAEGFMTAPPETAPDFSNECVTLSGIITEVHDTDNTITAEVVTDSCGINPAAMEHYRNFNLHLIFPESPETPITPYARITWTAPVTPLTPRPAISAIDHDKILRDKGFAGKAFVRNKDIIRIDPGRGPIPMIMQTRREAERVLFDTDMLPGAKSFVAATVFGDTSYMDEESRRRYSSAGIAHILAISGTHVAVLIMILSIVLLPLNMGRWKIAKTAITLAAVWAYCCFTGMSPPAVRAAIMASVFIPIALIQRRHSPLNSLCLAALIILIADPRLIYDMGTQLSFCAVAGIIMLGNRMVKHIPRRKRLIYVPAQFVATTLSAVAATAPLAAYYIHSVPILFIPATLTATLLLPPLFIITGLVLIANYIGIDCQIATAAINGIYESIDYVATTTASIPGTSVTGIYFSAWCIVPWYVALTVLAVWLRTRRPALIWFAGLSAALSVVLIPLSAPKAPYSQITVNSRAKGTVLLIKNGKELHCMPISLKGDTLWVMEDIKHDYSDYMAVNGIDSLKFARRPQGDMIELGDKILAIARTPEVTAERSVKADYLYIGGDVRSRSISRYLRRWRPDTVMIGADVNINRLRAYMAECDSARCPVIDMREASEWQRAVGASR